MSTAPSTAATTVTTPAQRQRRTVTPAQRVLRLAAFETRMLARQRTTLVTLLCGPLMVLLLVAVGGGGSPEGMAAITGMGALVVMTLTTHFAAVMLTVNRRESQVLKRLRTSELSSGELVGGMFAPLVVVGLLEALAVLAVVAWRGGPLPDAMGWLPWLTGAAVASFGLVASGVVVAGLSGNAEKANWAAVPMLVVVAGAANLLTVTALPEAVRQVLLLVPFASLTDLLARSSSAPVSLAELPVLGGAVPGTVVDLLLLVFWSAVSLWLARRTWRWEPRG